MRRTDPLDSPAGARRRTLLKGGVLVPTLLALGGCGLFGLTQEIDRPATEDARVASDVKLALIEAERVDAAAISVTAAEDGGPVTLGGFVASEAEREAALAAARSALGARQLVDEIEVRR